jgi:hypothetical protein
MSALAEQWERSEATAAADGTTADGATAGSQIGWASERARQDVGPTRRRSTSRDGAAAQQTWNVLAEQLVAYPPRSRQARSDEPARSVAHPGDARSAAYASAWLDDELARLRERRLSVRTSFDELEVSGGRACRGQATQPSRSRGPVGDPSTGGDRELRPVRRAQAGTGSSTLRDAELARRPAALQARAGQLPAARSRTLAAVFARGLRRLLPGAATLAVLAGGWLGASSLASAAHQGALQHLSGTVTVAGRSVYVIQPGDTLWSIASRLEPTADPRPLVDQFEAQLNGGVPQPGDRLTLPRSK